VTRPLKGRRCYCKQLGRRSRQLKGFALERDRCRDRVPPVGGGEAISHSAPFRERICFYAAKQAHVGQVTPCRSVSAYFHHRHQGRLSGAPSAAWAVCSKMWSSWTSRRRASSSSAWAWTWACRMVTRASVLPSWLLRGWSLGSKSISHRKPWGVGSRCASSFPLPMRRLIVSVETPKRRAASPTDTFSTIFLLFGMGNSIGVCLGNRLGAAWAIAARSLPREGEHRSFPPSTGPPSQRRTRPAGGPALMPPTTNRGAENRYVRGCRV